MKANSIAVSECSKAPCQMLQSNSFLIYIKGMTEKVIVCRWGSTCRVFGGENKEIGFLNSGWGSMPAYDNTYAILG